MNLYCIAAEYQKALDCMEVDPDTGEVTGMEGLDAISSAFEVKAESIALYAKGVKAEAEAIRTERAVLEKRMKAAERKLELLKMYLASNMDAVGREKLKTPRCSITFRKTARIEVSGIGNLPDEFKKVTVEPRKSDIAAALRAGETVPGAAIVESRLLQIR